MRKGWEIKKLEEICEFSNGLWTGKKTPFVEVGVIRNTNFTKDCNLDFSDIVFLMVEKSQYLKRKLKFGDIIIEKSGGGPKQPVGRVVLFQREVGEFSYSNFTSVIRIKEHQKENIGHQFLHKFLMYEYVSGSTEKMQSHSTGIRNLKFDEYKAIKVSIPPLPEQQRIVSILDEAFSSIEQAKENLQRNLQNTKEVFQSEINSIFSKKGKGWEEKTLKEISLEFGRGKSKHRPRGDESLLGGDFPLIQTGEISNSNHWITSFTRTYNEKGLAQSKLWEKGTICIAIVGANVAETGILTFDACFPDSVIGIVVNPKCANNQYVEYLLQTFKAYLKEKGKGTARDNINMGTFESQKFPFPNVETQQKIVQQLDKLSTETKRLEAMYQQKLDALEELKKSILQKAFSGELNRPERA
jgi:type I restriction enzyme, S subunit